MSNTLDNNTIKMQETCNNCFGSKICSMTLRQAKTVKHECQNITKMCKKWPQMSKVCFNICAFLICVIVHNFLSGISHIAVTFRHMSASKLQNKMRFNAKTYVSSVFYMFFWLLVFIFFLLFFTFIIYLPNFKIFLIF